MDIKSYWDDNWNNKYTEDGKKPSLFAKHVFDFIKDKNIKTILDLGAGKGRDANFFSQHQYDITAQDISAAALEYIRQNNPAIKTICSDLTENQTFSQQYDLIFANLSLHYFDENTTLKIFQKLHQALTTNGLLCFACKSVHNAEYGKGTAMAPHIFEHGHIRHFFSEEYTQELLRQSRFKPLRLREQKTDEPHYGQYIFIECFAQKL